jgi:hypothetical protein
MSAKEPKIRRAKARPVPVVMAVMEDRLAMLIAAKTDPIYVELHCNRLLELMDEFKRASGGRPPETEEVTA